MEEENKIPTILDKRPDERPSIIGKSPDGYGYFIHLDNIDEAKQTKTGTLIISKTGQKYHSAIPFEHLCDLLNSQL